MNRIFRFLLPAFVLAALALSLVGVAFARELIGEDPRPMAGDRSFSGEMEFYGTLEAVEGPAWTVDGVVFTVSPQTEIKGAPAVGSFVKVHASLNGAGLLAAREIETAAPGQARMDDNSNGNSNDDGAGHDLGDDNSNGNSNDDGADHDLGDDNSNGNDDGAGDDMGDDNSNGNSNDDGADHDMGDDHGGSRRGGKSGRGG
jgi:hypothetical protein